MTESKTEQSETLLVEELSRKISDVTQELNQLKNGLDDLSMEEKNTRLVGIESLIIDCSENLEDLESDTTTFRNKGELQELRVKVDTLIGQKEELRNQIGSQIQLVDESNQSVTENQNDGQQTEEGQGKKGLRKWWSSLTDKEKKSVRTVGGLAGLGILGLGIFRGRRYDYEKEIPGYSEMSRKKKREARRELRHKKRKERRENRPGWQKFLIGGAIAGGTVVGGVQVYKNWNRIKSWVKEKLGKSLTFEESISSVEAEVYNGVHKEDNFGKVGAHFEGIHFNEETSEVDSFGEVTKIDYKKKTIYTPNGEGIGKVQFSDRKELLHAVNIVNFAKRALKGRASNPKPFTVSSVGGDIDFEGTEFMGASGSNFWTYLLGGVGAAGGGLLGGYCAGIKGAAIGTVAGGLAGYVGGSVIDNESTMNNICPTIKKGTNLHLFVNYLNDQKDENGKSLWESAGEQHIDPDGSPINGLVDNGEKEDMAKREGVLAEIEKEYGEDQSGRRNFNILWDKEKPQEYIIQSYGQKARLTIEGGPTDKQQQIDYSKITKIHIEKYQDTDWGKGGLNIDFPKTEEGLKEAIRVCNLTNMIREDRGLRGGDSYPFYWGRYSTPPCLDMDTSGFRGKTILSRDGAKKTPTLFKDLQKGSTGGLSAAVGYTKDYQTKMQNNAINDTTEGSQYIKFLHQMGQGKYWKDPRASY